MTVEPTIFPARRIITMNPEQPAATAVSVARDRIRRRRAVESLEGTVAHRFADAVVLPGLIDQHLHPVLGATTLVTDVIATEDWDLPGRCAAPQPPRPSIAGRLAEARGGAGRSAGMARLVGLSPAVARSARPPGPRRHQPGPSNRGPGSAAVTNGS